MTRPPHSLALDAVARLFLAACASCLSGSTSSALEDARTAFPSATTVRPLTPSEPAHRDLTVLIVESGPGHLGYVVDQQVVSRSGPFRIRVIIDQNFRVLRARVLEYRGERGREVRRRSFTQQFVGKGPGDPIRLGEDVEAVTGATISSRAMADGVRRAVRMASNKLLGMDRLSIPKTPSGHDQT